MRKVQDLPCHANKLINSAISGVHCVPAATMAVPFAGPVGVGPAGREEKRASRSWEFIFSISWTVGGAIVTVLLSRSKSRAVLDAVVGETVRVV
jgi:hypothetical protein